MFYFIKFVDNNIIQIILLVSLATLLFYALGSVAQNYFHFKTKNNNFTIPFGIIIYFLITFILYVPFIYFLNLFNLDKGAHLYLYLYLIKQFIFTFVVLIFLNSLVSKWNITGWKQVTNFFVSVVIIGFLLWLFHFLLTTVSPIAINDESIFSFDNENFLYQSVVLELNIIVEMNNNINKDTILFWIIPFIMISLLYWSSKLLFVNIISATSISFATFFTTTIILIFSFLIVESLIYIIVPIIYLYFVLIYLYAKESFGDNLIIFFAIYALFAIFTISSSGFAFLLVLGVPIIGYLFMRAKSTVSLFLLFITFFVIELFFILTVINILYGVIFLAIAIIILIPMYAILNSAKVKDLIQVEKTIKRNAMLVVYFSLGITIFLSFILGLKSNDGAFIIIGQGFSNMAYPALTISLVIICSLYFIFTFYIVFFKKDKANNLLLITSLIILIGFNPLSLALFSYLDLMEVNIFQIYYFVYGIIMFLNVLNYLQNELNFSYSYNYKKFPIINKISFKSKK